MIVIDASAVVHALLDRGGEAILDLGGDAAAPHLLDLEVLSAFRRAFRRRHVSEARIREAIDDFAAWQIERYSHELLRERVWELRDNVTAYDAAYVALAEVLDVPLYTRDARLARSTGHQARIEYIE